MQLGCNGPKRTSILGASAVRRGGYLIHLMIEHTAYLDYPQCSPMLDLSLASDLQSRLQAKQAPTSFQKLASMQSARLPSAKCRRTYTEVLQDLLYALFIIKILHHLKYCRPE